MNNHIITQIVGTQLIWRRQGVLLLTSLKNVNFWFVLLLQKMYRAKRRIILEEQNYLLVKA